MQDDYGNVTLVNVSGIYDEQPLFIDKLKKGGAGVIDAVSMTGTNGYCDDMAKENFREMMKEYPTKGIHFIDGGNYHYLTLLWLSLIEEPFDLIVILICKSRHLVMFYHAAAGLEIWWKIPALKGK